MTLNDDLDRKDETDDGEFNDVVERYIQSLPLYDSKTTKEAMYNYKVLMSFPIETFKFGLQNRLLYRKN